MVPAMLASWLPAAAIVAAVSGPGGLSINPVQVSVSPAAPTAVLTLRNQDASAHRFQLTVFTWVQRPDTGEPLLTPTNDVLVSPPLLILAPGEERKIRIASMTPFGPVEKTYRLRIQQLQPPKTPESTQQLQMLTAFSVPIFLSPAKPALQIRTTALGLDGHRWSLALENTGNVHLQISTMAVKALGGGGETVFERKLDGAYVLPGMRHVFEIGEVPRDCTVVQKLRVDMKTSRGAVSDVVDVPQPACAR
jgi:fimbrial chaperone protein